MASDPTQTTNDHARADGFSRAELLRRANVFYDFAASRDRSPEQRRTDIRLAQKHEDAARHV